jgi:putative transposase
VSPGGAAIDVLLVAPLDEERDALLVALRRGGAPPMLLPAVDGESSVYYRATLPVAAGAGTTAAYALIVTCIGAMGPPEAAAAVTSALARWRPRAVLIVGIAGVLSRQPVGVARGAVCDTRRVNEHASLASYKRHRFPPAIIGHAVWRYLRFALRYRDVEELLAERGVLVTDETVRQWCRKFGRSYAHAPRRRRPRTGDKWHLDEVFVGINGQQHYRWRAVDQDGNVRDILVPARRDTRAAARCLRKLLKGLADVPRVVITDTLASDGAAMREVLPSVEHRRHKGLNNRAENSHQPTRERKRRMRRCKDPGHARRFLAAYGPIAAHFRPRRHRLTAAAYRQTRAERLATWRAVTGTPVLV